MLLTALLVVSTAGTVLAAGNKGADCLYSDCDDFVPAKHEYDHDGDGSAHGPYGPYGPPNGDA